MSTEHVVLAVMWVLVLLIGAVRLLTHSSSAWKKLKLPLYIAVVLCAVVVTAERYKHNELGWLSHSQMQQR